MRSIAAAAAVLFVAASCEPVNTLKVTFGDESEGLDGFLCKDTGGQYILERVRPTYEDGGTYGPDAGVAPASFVTDFIVTNGVQDCRTSQLIKECKKKDCSVSPSTRFCVPIQLPYGLDKVPREDVRALVKEQLKTGLKGEAIADAPDGFVMMRAIATTQSCAELMPTASGVLPEFDKKKLVGCAYSCPLLFDRLQQEVYLGFDTLTGLCEQGLRTCSDSKLIWNP